MALKRAVLRIDEQGLGAEVKHQLAENVLKMTTICHSLAASSAPDQLYRFVPVVGYPRLIPRLLSAHFYCVALVNISRT